MSEDDDWFERALAEDENDDKGRAGEPSPDDSDGSSDETLEDEGLTGGEQSPPQADDEDDDGGLFEQDFAAEFGGAGSPGGPGGPSGGEGGAFDTTGGSGDFDMGGAGGEFGGDSTPSGADEFADEEFESELPRLDLGVEGLDDMIQGGVPERSLMAVIGSAGTGKTTLGLEFLDKGLANGDRGVYITLEESRSRIIDSATEKGMPYEKYTNEGDLAIVDIDPVEMANSLSSIQNELPALVERFGAERLVLDSVSLLELMYENRAKRRNEVYTFARSLKESGVTTLLTSEADDDNPYASRHGIVEYLTDVVFIMRYVRPEDFRETRLAIEIQKIRDANHSREMKPYEITDTGLNVYRQANIF